MRWVYVEMGTTCYIKADHGETRDKTNPLTAQDEIEFAPKPEETEDATEAGNSTGVTEAPSRKKRETTEKTLTAEEIRIAGKAARTELRLAELAVTHTGEPDCVPPKESKLLFSKVFIRSTTLTLLFSILGCMCGQKENHRWH